MQINPSRPDAVGSSIQSEALNNNQFRANEVPPGSSLLVGDAAVFNVAGHLCSTQAECPRKQGPLNEGKLDGSTVTCPWHGSQFDVCTGIVLQGPAVTPLKMYSVVLKGDIGRVEAL